MPAENTPMKSQYNAIKAQYPDCLLFFRLGDFYEMFDEDAAIGAKELDLALTTRDRGRPEDERTPMCGVPYHAAEQYISRLIAKGYRVAVCEQMEDPKLAKGLVKRDIIRIISPGTVMESSMLQDGVSNYLAAVTMNKKTGACAFADISTGEVCVAAFETDAAMHILNELSRFRPKEAVLNAEAGDNPELRDALEKKLFCRMEIAPERFEEVLATECIRSQYGAEPSALLPGESEESVLALGALLHYLAEAQRGDMRQLRAPDVFTRGRYMELDPAARRNLELTENLRTGDKRGSLLWVLDKTETPMGGRMLRQWVERPLLSPVAIRRRLSAVDELVRDNVGRSEIILHLHGIGDIQRLTSRAVYGTANGRDMLSLGKYLEKLPELFNKLTAYQSGLLRSLAKTDPLQELDTLLLSAIGDEPPFSVREGGILRPGYNEEVDRLRDVRDNGARLVAELEARERERTGVKKLKVGYNRVFGFYIDVPNSAGAVELPEEYIRKQTLTNAERYFTPELKALEDEITSARERIEKLEYDLFMGILQRVAGCIDEIQTAAEAVATVDTLASLAEVAVRNNYVCPEVEVSRELMIREGRHPVVEQMQKSALFVPNDTHLNDSTDRVAIVTGPNMAGKSTYMRQTAIIVLMAQMGSFVPASSACIGVVDRVFTRIGASDDLAGGQSTFMVEMSEIANILKNATADSLLVLDEIGRGTSTYDGMAIARAVLEYCADPKKLGAKTMFATHYHELSALEGTIPGVKNYNISAKRQNGKLLFLRKIVPGATDDSYGIEVAKLAGVPEPVIRTANMHLQTLTAAGAKIPAAAPQEREQVSLQDMSADSILMKLRALDPDSLTPREAMELLYELKKDAET